MIYARIIGGLGNSMFQYAFAKKISKILNTNLKLDFSMYPNYYKMNKCELEIFNLPEEYSYKNPLNKIIKIKFFLVSKNLFDFSNILNEKNMYFYKINLKKKFPLYISGYWQSYKYFDDIKKELLDLFKFPIIKDKKNLDLLNFIRGNHTTSIFCRRGDFVSNKTINNIHGFCDLNYYKKSILIAKEKSPKTKLIFYSDDTDWLKNNFNYDDNIIVDWNKNEPYRDMELYSKSNINISSNSSFSWWGSYINVNKDKVVIVPNRWYKKKSLNFIYDDLIPSDWIKV